MKIFCIGPIYPLRGGIAHSHRVQCENLSKNNDVTVISFSQMWPKLIYPGKDQRELNADPSFKLHAEYPLDSMNPLTWLEVARKIKREQPDWVVFRWNHTFFAPMFWVITTFGKNPKTKYSALCGNVEQHEGSWLHNMLNGLLHKPLQGLFFHKLDYIITCSSADYTRARELYPRIAATWITESTYEKQFGVLPTKEVARKKLHLHGDTLLFFGFVRAYKGLKFLIEAMPLILQKKPALKLMIVGEFWEDKQPYMDLIHSLGVEKNIVIVDKYVSNEEVPTYFAAADAVVLPYVSSSESGIIQLAYGLNTPVMTSAVGGNVDLIENHKTGMLFKPQDPMDLARAVVEFYDLELEKPIRKGMLQNADLFKWTTEKEAKFLRLPQPLKSIGKKSPKS